MSTHDLKLAAEPFEAIKSGNKIIESRLFDEKRQAIRLGDQIIFTNRERPSETVTTKVVGLLRYPTFADMFSDNDPRKFGGPSAEWLLDQIQDFYSSEEQQQYGVVGIRIQVL